MRYSSVEEKEDRICQIKEQMKNINEALREDERRCMERRRELDDCNNELAELLCQYEVGDVVDVSAISMTFNRGVVVGHMMSILKDSSYPIVKGIRRDGEISPSRVKVDETSVGYLSKTGVYPGELISIYGGDVYE